MNSRDRFQQLRDNKTAILPSLLQCDFGDLKSVVRQLEAAGAAGLHLDVMDGHFVPNFTYGMPIVHACRNLTDLPVDVHLMIEHPDRYLAAFCDAGADSITFHVEAVEDPEPLLKEVRKRNVAVGLALNSDTPLERVEPFVDQCDLLLVMSVQAGFGGQKFNPIALEKLKRIRSEHADLVLEVDGGVSNNTIADCAAAGAQLFVVGSAIFGQADFAKAIDSLTQTARG